MGLACLENRGVVRVKGEEAEQFLQNLLTCDVETVVPGQAAFGALLTPQGKILFDFFVFRVADGGFLFDIARDRVESFIKRLGFYRLRARVTIEDISTTCTVAAGWGDTRPSVDSIAAAADPRLAALGWRTVIGNNGAFEKGEADTYHARRIELCIPEGGIDFPFEEHFPHDVGMDQLNGISFTKGCYIGQEVVSRMQHRGTARTRILAASLSSSEFPPPETDIIAGDRIIGKTGSATPERLVAIVRIDKVLDAMAAGEEITASGIQLSLDRPEWAGFDFSAAPKDNS